MSAPPEAAAPAARQRSGRRTLLLLALVTIAPVIASYSAYYFFPREKLANYGELLPTGPAPAVAGTTADGAPRGLADWRGKWVLLAAAPGGCDAGCRQALYATRQARTMQGREMERIVRVWLVTDGADPDPALVAEHPDLAVVRAPGALAAWPRGAEPVYLVDPLGNLVLAYPRDPDIKGVAKDLARLLKASRIG